MNTRKRTEFIILVARLFLAFTVYFLFGTGLVFLGALLHCFSVYVCSFILSKLTKHRQGLCHLSDAAYPLAGWRAHSVIDSSQF